MAAQDEGHIDFARLPLADLKTWLEDNLALEGNATIIGGAGGGNTIVTNPVVDEQEFLYPAATGAGTGITVPKWHGWYSSDRNFIVAEVVFSRFAVVEDVTVSGLSIISDTGVNAADTWDVGIYNNAGTSKLCSSGAVTPTASGDELPFAFTANQVLTANTHYLLAVMQAANGGVANNYVACNVSNTHNRWFGNTFATWLTGKADNGGTPYATLPGDLSAATNKAQDNAAGPMAVLHKV